MSSSLLVPAGFGGVSGGAALERRAKGVAKLTSFSLVRLGYLLSYVLYPPLHLLVQPAVLREGGVVRVVGHSGGQGEG